jgi:flagellar M-ring protein FliF
VDGLKSFIDNLKERMGGLSFNQKVMLGAVATASIISLSVFSIWLQKEDMGVLFTNLTLEDASATLQELNKQNIKTELTNGGSTILVPESEALRLRVDLQHKGVISNSTVGFDIFDGKQYGLTEFLQNVQFKRATEGELTRTIEALDGIQTARVHLVMPKPSIFNKNSGGATASVTLKMGRGVKLKENQVSGIQSLVSASVENLDPANVRIHDTSGQELSAVVADDDVGRSETQLALRKEVERHLTAKASSMLDRSLGQGKSVVEVNATLNFEKIESEREIFDPQGVVTRSEERTESVNPQTGGTDENSLTNYEINRTVEHIVSETGGVTQLVVSVMVDGHYAPAEDGGEPVYTPLNENEIGQLRRIVSAAVGLNAIRGDQIEFVNFQFQQSDEIVGGRGMTPDWIGIVTQYGGKLVLILLFGVMAFALKKNLGNVLSNALQPGGKGGVAGADGVSIEEESFDGIPEIDDQIMDDIQDYASENPERVAEVIQSWINEIDLGPVMTAKAGD